MKMIKPIKYNLQDYISIVLPQALVKDKGFSARIKKRHKMFWTTADAEVIRNTPMNAGDPIEKWKDVKNWQRKLSNKYNSREFAVKHSCKVARLYWKGKDYNSINFDNLPHQYVIRPTTGHSSGLVFLMNNSINLMDGRTYSNEEIRAIIAKAVTQKENLEFLIEEFLRTENGEYKIPVDYKFYTFNGEVACIWVIDRKGPKKGFASFYNENWQLINNVNSLYPPPAAYQKEPECLQEMLVKAKELSKSYEIFVRIDFYATDKGAVFGEFTPTPSLGQHFTPEGDKLLLNYWDKYCKGLV